jgi:hypothetical protein
MLHNIITDFGAPMKLVRLIKMCLNKTYNKVRIGKYLLILFLFKTVRKNEMLNVLLLFFKAATKVAAHKKPQISWNTTLLQEPLIYQNISLTELYKNLKSIRILSCPRTLQEPQIYQKHKSSDASDEDCVELNTDKTEHILLSRHQNARQYHNIKTSIRSFKNVAKFKYL